MQAPVGQTVTPTPLQTAQPAALQSPLLTTPVLFGLGLLAVGLTLALVLAAIATIAKRRGSAAPALTLSPAQTSPPPSPDARTQATELARLIRELTAELDARAARLEALIDQAQHHADRLEALNSTAEHALEHPARAAASPAAALPTTAPSNTAAPEATSNTSNPDDKPARALRLHRQGLSPVQIAQTLGMHVGHVELIVALDRAQTKAAATR